MVKKVVTDLESSMHVTLKNYAYCEVTKYDFRLIKIILIFWLNFPLTMY